MRRHLVGTLAAFVALCACASRSTTSPELVPDGSLTFETARARWVGSQPSAYTFEFDVQGAMLPSPGFARATVVDGRLVDLRLAQTGGAIPLTSGFTIDQLWDRLIAAKAGGATITDLQFTGGGIPIRAMVGSFADDSGVLYRIRAFEQTR